MALSSPEFCQKTLVQKWLSGYQSGDLYNLLKEHWRVFVLVVFQFSHDQAKEDRLADKFLFCPLEHFLCNGDPEEVFKQLKERDKPSQLCGRVFKNGEPTYSCRDCACDPTCVLCIECFQKSVHKKHRYRMSTSGGGGYCDCGDPEAWKNEPFCEIHKRGVISQDREQSMEEQNPLELLPDDLIDRASALFMATLKYTVELLTWEQSDTLPSGLQPEQELQDSYICMLFNDEVHTYEHVITTLQRAVNCTHKQAVDFATTVDREGRSSVREGVFEDCEKARGIIETNSSRHGGKPLKVQVMHNTVVAHQQFALKMIQWLLSVISKSDGLRRLLCLLSMQQQEDGRSLMEILLLSDTKLWKVARTQSHQLMMAGVLMDQECKKKFAIMYTKLYPQLMKDYSLDDHEFEVSVVSLSVQIYTVTSLHYKQLMRDFAQDDHYRPVSVTSISVQIFTVPTLARMLVTDHNLLSVIIDTFLVACEEKKNRQSDRLQFERTERGQAFKRSCYMLYDLKYALVTKPTPSEWNDALRQSFLQGFSSFLQLLKMIQGMDAVTRQTGQHLEFDPEWEGAFNLQVKLEDNIHLFLDWCGSDRQVLIESYNKALEVFDKCKGLEKTKKENCTVALHTVKCLKHDVSTQPVSVHLPISRLLAGLQVNFGKYGLAYTAPDCSLVKPDPMELLEHPLRVQVLVAQVQAGMWRRNGYALLNQIYFYHNVKCRAEMYDRDVLMIQVAASMFDSDHFLIHVLNKFNLLLWVKHDYDTPLGQDDYVRQTVMLAEECLELLIIILSERYVPGVGEITPKDVVKREVIHQLCITPMAHSELAKTLPEDPNHETGLENAVNEVAVFKKPAVSTGVKGKYELKPECYAQYNPYFYHYSKVEKSKSEEAQVKRRKESGESQALPPPDPPAFTNQFKSLINILQCDVMIHIMDLLLTRTAATRSRSWSETQLERVLHLIGLALHEQKRAILCENKEFDFLSKATKQNKDGKSIVMLLESVVGNQNISHDCLRDLLSWTLKLFTEVRHLRNEPVSMDTIDHLSSPKDAKVEAEKKKKAAVAAKRRAKIMAQMKSMQKNFIRDNAELFASTSTELLPRNVSEADLGGLGDVSHPVAIGPKKSVMSSAVPNRGTCILCQEEQEISLMSSDSQEEMGEDSGKPRTKRAMVLAAFVQKSTVLSLNHGKWVSDGEHHDPLFTPSDLYTGTHTSSCGHMMHADCWQRFFDSVVTRERRRPMRFRHNFSYDIEKNEFLCPLCECLSNTVIPVLPALSSLCGESEAKSSDIHLSFNDWLDGIHKTVKSSIKHAEEKEDTEDTWLFEPCPVSTISRLMAESVAKNFKMLWSYVCDGSSGNFSQEMREMLRKFSLDVYTFGLEVPPDDENSRVPIMAWNTCAYTIQSTEQLLRDEKKALFGALPTRLSDCLKALVNFAAVCSQVMPADKIKEHCVRLLSVLFPDVVEGKVKDTPCLLDMDMFHYLTVLVMSLPSLYSEGGGSTTVPVPSGGLNDLHAVHLVLAAHLVQILLTFDEENCGMEVDGDYEGEALLIIRNRLRMMAGMESESSCLPWQLNVHVRKAVLPFLRCTAMLYHFITGVNPPMELQEAHGEEFDHLCRYLGMHTHMSRVLEGHGEVLDSIVARWCKSQALKDRLSATSQPLVKYPLRINKLIPLPEDYSELINKVSTFTCPRSDGDDSRAPTMCLVCGQMLCSQSYCCQTEVNGVTMGAATEHTITCGGGTGIFLRVRECQILLLAGKTKGCFVPPPYLDNYGETDQGLRRGNPLHLCEDDYRQLQKMWNTHAIPETIAHHLESNSSFLTIDWQHL